MKLRIRDNSIRLRLTRGEVDTLAGDGIVEAAVHFPDGARLVYCIESSPACVDPVANFNGVDFAVRLPKSTVDEWSQTEQVSIDAQQLLPDGNELRILVEKDFACLAPREEEDESDTEDDGKQRELKEKEKGPDKASKEGEEGDEPDTEDDDKQRSHVRRA